MNLSLSKEIEKIVENMFLIKILNKDKKEIDNFESTIKNINSIDLKILFGNHLVGFSQPFNNVCSWHFDKF